MARLNKLFSSEKQTVEQISDVDEASSKGGVVVPAPPEIYNSRIVVIAVTAAFAAVIIGYDAGFIGGTVSLASFQLMLMTSAEKTNIEANVVSVFQAGAFFGALFFYPIGEIWGRKLGLTLSAFLLVFGAVITGVGVGGSSGLAPIYISECSPVKIRGKLVGTWELSWQVGGILGYWINYGVLQTLPASTKQWMIPFGIQLIPSGFFFIGSFFIPESPRFLIQKDKIEEARSSLSMFRKLSPDHPYSVQEMDILVRDVEDKKLKLPSGGFFAPTRKILQSKKLLLRMLLSTSLFPMQNGSGINAITYYSPKIFASFGIVGSRSGLLSTGIFGILKAAAALVWMFFIVERFGRRTALVWFSIPCSIAMWYIGAYIKIADPTARVAAGNTTQDAGGRAAQAMLYIWTVFYGVSWNGTPWVINADIFGQEVRTVAQAVNAMSNWFWAFIMGRFSGQAVDAIGFGFYFIFASCMLVFPVVVYLFYPETKGVPLEAVDYLFEVPAWKARDCALAKYENELVDRA
ncbi:Quinate permease [Candida viswanathii]|uniref:Quinate transporter n=1 Tax=Candida viswanathii TaxID=5486 RepID=A0A367YCR6_9ASCO|nr:Quinate permease [Candida viswanathii]